MTAARSAAPSRGRRSARSCGRRGLCFAPALPLSQRLHAVQAPAVVRLQALARSAWRRRVVHAAVAAARTCWHRVRCALRSTVGEGVDPLVACGGGGIFFFWQLGASAALLEERRRLVEERKQEAEREKDRNGKGEVGEKGKAENDRATGPTEEVGLVWAGSSAGALCAVLAMCGVDARESVIKANTIAKRAGVYERPLGLAGVWGGLIRRWLNALLPEDAAQRCSGKVAIHVTVWRGWRRGLGVERVTSFRSRDDLIAALMASVHIPWFLDGRLWARLVMDGKEKRVMDGSALGFIPMRKLFGIRDADLVVTSEAGRTPNFVITHLDDLEYIRNGPVFTELIGVDAALGMVERGYSFTKSKLADADSV